MPQLPRPSPAIKEKRRHCGVIIQITIIQITRMAKIQIRSYQVLARMEGNWNSHTLLEGMKDDFGKIDNLKVFNM
jgi:hypothetical protein